MHRKAIVIWFTGMSGAGKSTLAQKMSDYLQSNQFRTTIIDGDHVRNNLHRHLSFSREDILENNRLVANLCKQNIFNYDVILVPIISPYALGRNAARETIGDTHYEVYIKASLDELIKRDTKGLYRKSLEKKIYNLIGFSKSNPYEEPQNPDLIIQTDRENLENSVNLLADNIQRWLKNVNDVNSTGSGLTKP